jgi:hypothetical protein
MLIQDLIYRLILPVILLDISLVVCQNLYSYAHLTKATIKINLLTRQALVF